MSNAVDAAPANGRIHISCSTDVTGKHVKFHLQDDGPGVPSEVSSKIFEPFFTTKKGVGTGLGLWVSREIVERHNGSLKLHDVPGELGEPNSACGYRAQTTKITVLMPVDLKTTFTQKEVSG